LRARAAADGEALERGASGTLTLHPVRGRLPLLVRPLRLVHSHARLTPSTLTVKRWFGWPRSVGRGEVSSVVLVAVRLGRSSRQPARQYVLFLGAGGRCLLSLDCLGIPLREVADFAHALEVPVQSRREQPDPRELRRDYPGSISTFWSRPVTAGVTLGILVTALVVAGVVGVAVLSGQVGPPRPGAPNATQVERTAAGRVAEVTLVAVDDPARAPIPASASEPGTHFAGVRIRVTNTGSRIVLRPSLATVVYDTAGTAYFVDAIDDAAAGQLNVDGDVVAGRTETAYVLIRVPDTAVLARVAFNSTSDEKATLSWPVPHRVSSR
jgi:hypothetical protein